MSQIHDQIDAYILKYKEELFKNSSNSAKNQEVIQKLRNYFDQAAQSGDFELQKALNRLMSPSSLARKHLSEAGVKVSKRRGFLSFVIFLCIFLCIAIGLAVAGLFYVIFPLFDSEFGNKIATWEIKYNGNVEFDSDEIEIFQGNIPVNGETRFYISADVLNANFKVSDKPYIFYKCEYKKDETPKTDFFERSSNQISVSFEGKTVPEMCAFEIPAQILLAIEAQTVNLEISPWNYELQVKAVSGNIGITLDSSIEYEFTSYVEQGNLQGLNNFKSVANGKKIEVYLRHGNLVFTQY